MLSSRAVRHLTFDAAFNSGNLLDVVETTGVDGDTVYELRIAADAHGTPHESSLRAWFYFSVTGALTDETLRFVIAPYSNQNAMVACGWRPVVRTPKAGWVFLRQPCNLSQQPHPDKPDSPPCWALHFRHTCSSTSPADTLFFAFSFPASTQEVHDRLDAVVARTGDACAPTGLLPALDGRFPPVYVARTVLTLSLEGAPLPLLVLSNSRGVDWQGERMARTWGTGAALGPMPHAFLPSAGKRSVLLSARVHPGEAPSTFILDGQLDVLTRPPGKDPRSDALRDAFVFFILPVLNPDGVERGQYRLDSRGVNLNRSYADPSPDLEPGIAAVKRLAEQLSSSSSPTPLALYLDLHAHANKRGAFLFGNDLMALHDEGGTSGHASHPFFSAQVDNESYARAFGLHTGWFDPSSCSFSAPSRGEGETATPGWSESDKEGCGRVALHAATGLTHAYTLECHYSAGPRAGCGHVPPATGDGGRSSPPTGLRLPGSGAGRPGPSFGARHGSLPPLPGPMSPPAWREVGRASLYAWLEMQGDSPHGHPWSRLHRSAYRNLAGLKRSVAEEVMARRADGAAGTGGPPVGKERAGARGRAAPGAATGRPASAKVLAGPSLSDRTRPG